MLRFFTAGESHGRGIIGVVDSFPAGYKIATKEINRHLARRQSGYVRGKRMQIENDRAEVLTGLRHGRSLGSPITCLIKNRDWRNWRRIMDPQKAMPMELTAREKQLALDVHSPRPGHADLAGAIKYQVYDLRNILERSSARETTMRVAAGAVTRRLLEEFGINIYGHVVRIGEAATQYSATTFTQQTPQDEIKNFFQDVEQSPVACADKAAEKRMIELIDQGKEKGDSLGGLYEIVATGLPVGLGSHVHWDRKLDAHIAYSMMSINAMKSVEIGLGKGVSEIFGSRVHDEIFYDQSNGFTRNRNNAGGLEGGMTNGEPIVVRVAMKPLPTMPTPLRSVDVNTKKPKEAHYERADVCAVPAAVVVAEAMLALVLANALIDKIGGDSIAEMKTSFEGLPNAPLEW